MDISIDKVITIALSAIALLLSIYNFNKTRMVNFYQDMDRLYLELLKVGIANPDFVNPDMTCDYRNKFERNQRLQYELYAFMAMNICETIYDRKASKSFFRTWECIIEIENRLHRCWLEDGDNKRRFKKDFIDYLSRFKDSK